MNPGARYRLGAALVRIASLLVPGERRSEWRRAWKGELWHWIHGRAEPGWLEVLGRTLGAFPHAVWERRSDHERDGRGERMMQDVRLALRGLGKTPAFTAVATATLALAIGANAAIFGVVRSVLLRPLPFPESERLVQLWETRLDRGWTQVTFSRANFWDVHDMDGVFENVGALNWTSLVRTGGPYPQRLSAALVSSGFFRALGAQPVAGRLFVAEEDRTGADGRAVLLSNALWVSEFGEDPGVVGRTLTLDGEAYEVVGVLPAGEPWLNAAELFVPMVRPADANRTSFELMVVGRLAPGVSVESASTRLDALARSLAERYPEADEGMGIAIDPASTWIADDTTRRALWLLMGAVGLLLLIGCSNVANLLLARGAERTREYALKAALGAGRGRIIRQVLLEAGVLSVAGAALGLGLAAGVNQLVRVYNPGGIPRLSTVSIDPWVVGFTLAAAVASALIASLLPALRAPGVDVARTLREGEARVSGDRGLGRTRAFLIGGEVALSLALLVGAGLLVRSLGQVLSVERGFATDDRVLFQVALPPDYQGEATLDFLNRYIEQVEAIPGVSSVAAVSQAPLSEGNTGLGYGAADAADDPGAAVPWADWRLVTGSYFATLDIPLLDGRTFGVHDRVEGPESPWRVVISQSVAERLWPGERAVGRTMLLWKGQGDTRAEVIGVVGDMRERDLAGDPTEAVYLPLYGLTWSPLTFVAHVDADGSVGTLAPALRQRLAGIDASLPLSAVGTLDEAVGRSVAARRFTMLLMSTLAAVALALSLAGVYGVLSYVTSRRTQEIGVRLALGSAPRRVMGLIVRQGLRPVALGLVVGLAASWALTRFMTSLLFGVGRQDPVTYAAVAVLMLAAALVACWIPARRAVRMSVATALRGE